MTEWHVTPDYIAANWTDELLDLMLEKLNERRKRVIGATQEPSSAQDHIVSDESLFSQLGGKLKVVKKHAD